jgi:hypothetical protein
VASLDANHRDAGLAKARVQPFRQRTGFDTSEIDHPAHSATRAMSGAGSLDTLPSHSTVPSRSTAITALWTNNPAAVLEALRQDS